MKPLRLIHTSDIHLDTSFSGSGLPSRLGDRKREAIRATFRRILDDARRRPADMVLIAGDLFEHDRVTPDTVEFLKQQFGSLGSIPVFIAPGNHDPFVHGSPYREEAWPANVHIFREERFQLVELPELGVRVAGFGFTRVQLDERPFLKLPALSSDLVNIVLSHASDAAFLPSGKSGYGPFTVDEIAGKNVQYCALGHYHQLHAVANDIDATPVWYSGIPEGRGWDEEGACGYLAVQIEDGVATVEAQTCNEYPLHTEVVNCDGLTTREQILDAILGGHDVLIGPKTLLRVRLQGTPDASLDLSFSELEERLAGKVLYVEWLDETRPPIDLDSIARERTLRGRFVRNLKERMTSAPEQERRTLERALLYGVEALLGREVRLR